MSVNNEKEHTKSGKNRYRKIVEDVRSEHRHDPSFMKKFIYEPSEREKEKEMYRKVGEEYWNNDFYSGVLAMIAAILVLWMVFFA